MPNHEHVWTRVSEIEKIFNLAEELATVLVKLEFVLEIFKGGRVPERPHTFFLHLVFLASFSVLV